MVSDADYSRRLSCARTLWLAGILENKEDYFMADKHILCIGAHPDDNEFSVGGTAARFREQGDSVHFISVTNGDRGHYYPEYIQNPALLAERRLHEARKAAATIGATYETLGIRDGEVYVTKEATENMIRAIRRCGEPGRGPDLVLFNRPQDYHRDHRYASQLVLDATYMLTVPTMCPEVRHLDRMPVFAYWFDNFTEVTPFCSEVIVSTESVIEKKIDMLDAHVSQVYEWLPYNAERLHEVPSADDPQARRAMLANAIRNRDAHRAKTLQEALKQQGLEKEIIYAEAFQICQYGTIPNEEALRELFPQ
jgi:LmbE family N-acetylglucosaminyl deacetylase